MISAVWPLLQQAEGFAAAKNWARAIDCYERALQAAPGDAGTLVQLSYVHSLAGHYRLAREYALRAHATGVRAPKVLSELIPRLRTFNAIEEMQDCIARLLPMSGIPIPMLIKLGAQLSYANLPGQAIEFLDEAKRADPDFPTTLLARAHVLMYLGRFEEARVDVLRALKRAPEIAQGYWLLTALGKQTAADNHVEQIRRQLLRPGRSPADLALLGFALHKALDDLGEHADAWEALMIGCRAKRAQLAYDRSETQAIFRALHAFPVDAPSRVLEESADELTPIFIVGMHRSGTTLLEQMLSGAKQLRAMGELYDFTAAMRMATDRHCSGVIDRELIRRAQGSDFSEVGRTYLLGMGWRLQGERFFTDKLPSNFLNIGFICQALPHAKILHMVRDPMEVCFSNLRELFSDANPYSYDQADLANFYRHYQELMRHWHATFPERVLDVDYSELTRHPERELRRVCDFCGLPFDMAMLDISPRQRGVVTASAVQVREGIVTQPRPKWVPYAQQLEPLSRILAAVQHS
ncbi:sulfotransferase [Pseudoxanthomonas helianthi]|uniref:Sulfotransferase n=1 Tax=Pseudoxanthomonas helianthi TaxID=1453541 RepID=A0A941ARS2_9GAMM|nr:sulfotransferase [Pseudoxanthomonas helianthi]MBP3983070.1 sulfotransferase [Pseudoxanthomonas helianthi]